MRFMRAAEEWHMNKEHGCGGCCSEGEEKADDVSFEELAEHNNLLVEALIELLLEKKIITEADLDRKISELEENDDEE